MPAPSLVKVPSLPSSAALSARLADLGLPLPVDPTVLSAAAGSPMAEPIWAGDLRIGNRWCIHPMEGWDGTPDGRPSEATLRRWARFGASGAKLIWGGEAVAVLPEGRANPRQLTAAPEHLPDLVKLRESTRSAHVACTGSDAGLVVGLQLTHSGRFCKPNDSGRFEWRLVYRHPLLDRRFGIPDNHPVLTDGEIEQIIAAFVRSAVIARDAGFHFVDIKHCHGYLGHEFLSAHSRPGRYGGTFENRTRFLREVAAGIQRDAPGLALGVRLSAFDSLPYEPDAGESGSPGRGIPVPWQEGEPYRFGFGCAATDPLRIDLAEPLLFLGVLRELGIRLVNLTAASPYYNPHLQRPALYPPSDGYQPPEDPLLGCARQLHAARELKSRFPDLVMVGTAYTYFQEFVPHVAQAVVREGWIDCVGLGRMVLSYPELPWETLSTGFLHPKRICRTFSDCTTAPRNGLVSGCYPLDPYYKESPGRGELTEIKRRLRPVKS